MNSSVLVGKASVGGDWNVVLACAVSILGTDDNTNAIILTNCKDFAIEFLSS